MEVRPTAQADGGPGASPAGSHVGRAPKLQLPASCGPPNPNAPQKQVVWIVSVWRILPGWPD
jgi:hypothetical protein